MHDFTTQMDNILFTQDISCNVRVSTKLLSPNRMPILLGLTAYIVFFDSSKSNSLTAPLVPPVYGIVFFLNGAIFCPVSLMFYSKDLGCEECKIKFRIRNINI